MEPTYTGNSSVNGFENREINSVSYDWANNLRLTNPTQFNAFQSNTQPFRPYPNYGSITFRTNGARSNYHAGTVKLDKRFSHGLSFLTLLHLLEGDRLQQQQQSDPARLDRAESSNNRTHHVHRQHELRDSVRQGPQMDESRGMINAIFGGFDMVYLYRIQSGDALTFGFSGSPFQYMPGVVAIRSGNRPNSTGHAPPCAITGRTSARPFLAGHAEQPDPVDELLQLSRRFPVGNVGRNTFDRQRFIDCQFSASKEWRIKERATATFRFDFQNPFKWYNLSAPNTT